MQRYTWMFGFFFLSLLFISKPVFTAETNLNMKKIVYISPGNWGDIFAIDSPYYNRDDALEPTYQLRIVAGKENYQIIQADSLNSLGEFEYLFVFEVYPHKIAEITKYPKEKLILFLWEPPSVLSLNYDTSYHQYFGKVFTWNDDLVDNKKYFKLYYPVMKPMINDLIPFSRKKLCTLIASNKDSSHPNELYSERRKVIDFYENHLSFDFDLYGKDWPTTLKTYRGPIVKKVDVLKLYKFAYAYENIREISGYVTEKIFDCFQAGCVPVYYGASNITKYIPKECFIAREDFESDMALYEYMNNMDEAQYLNYQKNIFKFLHSEKAKLFSCDYFIKNMMTLIKTSPKL